MNRLFLLLCAMVACPCLAYGQSACLDFLSLNGKQLKDWTRTEVQWLIAPAEKTAYAKLSSAKDQKEFIKNFWLRRDSDPDTDQNEFLVEFCSRISYTSKFTSGISGFKTDRGRVYLLWGSPTRLEKEKGNFEGLSNVAFERWHYEYVPNIGSDISVTFIDPTESNEFRFLNTDRIRFSPILDCYNRGILPNPRQKGKWCIQGL